METKGDIEEFEEIYRRHNKRVYSICFRMLRNASEAEDLTQQVFIQLFRKLHTFRGESSFTTWLHRLTVNQVLMHLRRSVVRTEKITDDGSTPVRVVRGTENPSRMALIDRIALNQAIGQLPPGYRMVFILHDLEGFEHEQIGKMLGCAVGTSKSQLHKARQRLRQLLTGRRITPPKQSKVRAQLTPALDVCVQPTG
ncbi:MAG TPA: sigma-70 family RNA polymerase sigma factor [Pyrinomonadaceae bacterium]|nr:sigma-70 family RNA polymerase sigma factor [Pyrinomonadaceae bacterium]